MGKCCFELNKSLFNIDGGGGCENYEEVANFATLPVTGDEDTTYKTLDDGKIFEWNGTEYVELSVQTTPIGATLMKTGQTTSYRTGDDGDIEAGREVDFFTLSANNPFGNNKRFTDELGTQTYANNIVIDWSTFNGTNVLGVYRVFTTTGLWAAQIDNCLALSIGIFTIGWRMSNRNEFNSLINFSAGIGLNYVPLNMAFTGNYWISTTDYGTPANAYYSNTGSFIISGLAKTGASMRCIPVRTFTVTGTTLT
jgi:hypothetical protein